MNQKRPFKILRTFLLIFANLRVFDKLSKIKNFDQLVPQLLVTFWSSKCLMCALKWQKTRFSTSSQQPPWKTCFFHFKAHIKHYDDQNVTKSWGTNWSKFFIFESLLKTCKFAYISKNVHYFLSGLFWFTLLKPLQSRHISMNHEIILTLTRLLLILFPVIDNLHFVNCRRQ